MSVRKCPKKFHLFWLVSLANSIHDAIVTTKDGLVDVEQALKQSFAPAGLVSRLAVKQLTV